jgi:DNA-binding transcriptional regulator YdaS (Cro superfamily)
MSNPVYDEIDRLKKRLGSQIAIAKSMGISPQYLSDIRTRRRPIPEWFANKLGFETVKIWRKI